MILAQKITEVSKHKIINRRRRYISSLWRVIIYAVKQNVKGYCCWERYELKPIRKSRYNAAQFLSPNLEIISTIQPGQLVTRIQAEILTGVDREVALDKLMDII